MSKHPSKDILGTESERLRGKRIALCITGSVAAVQSSDIARALMRQGAEVYAVMSASAQKIIHPYLMEWATGNPVVTDLTGKIEHVALAGEHSEKADLVLVAPATANTIGKIACGIDDTTVTSVVTAAFGSKIPVIVAPAMHDSMYNHPILNENIKKLMKHGVEFIDPRIEQGKAKIANTNEIVQAVIRKLAASRDFAGLKILISAGPTVEHIDPIRVVTNKSSGKMGIAIAEEALDRGAEVTLVYGLGAIAPPSTAEVINVETTEQMREAFLSELKSKKYDLAIAVAAVADWTPEKAFTYKVSTHKQSLLNLKLRPTAKIIDEVKRVSPKTFLVAFRAEYNLSKNELIESAFKRLVKAKADLVIANDVGKKDAGFRVDTNEVFIVDKEKKVTHVPLASKREIARRLLNVVREKIRPEQ